MFVCAALHTCSTVAEWLWGAVGEGPAPEMSVPMKLAQVGHVANGSLADLLVVLLQGLLPESRQAVGGCACP